MDYLEEDENIEELIVSMITDFRERVEDEDIHSQVIDPFSSMIEASLNELDYENWIKSETSRQRQKTLQNAIGKLHQKLLGKIIGVDDLDVGNWIDVVCQEKRIIAEVKTKHNTVKKTDLYSVYDELKEALNMTIYAGYTAYYVEIIPAKPSKYIEAFTPLDNNTKVARPEREDIKRIDGRSFYELLTGDPDALEKMNNKIKEILINNFDLQEPEQFTRLFKRAYEVGFSIQEEINEIEELRNVELLETENINKRRKLLWKHGECEFKSRINQLLKVAVFTCPECASQL